MSVLSGPEILRLVLTTKRFKAAGEVPPLPAVDIDPFVPAHVGPNSYDLTLGPTLRRVLPRSTYTGPAGETVVEPCLDVTRPCVTEAFEIPPTGYVLRPGEFVLGATAERTMTSGLVPWIDGRSSVGRMSVQVHATAGRGDDGFGEALPGGAAWTLELSTLLPVRLFAGVRIAQITYFTLLGDRQPYAGRYATQAGPTASRLAAEFDPPPR